MGLESKSFLRFSDLTSESKRLLPPIKGFEEVPLVCLEKAVEPLVSLVPEVEQMVWVVKQNCDKPEDGLSQDESASIMLYSMEWIPHETSFYFIFNSILRSEHRSQLIPWFLYLRLVINALSKLPWTSHRIIYRGIKMDMGNEFPEGKIFFWWGFSSCTSSINVLENFLGKTGTRTIFNIECDSGKDISKHSFYQKENEVLVYPARQFKVISSLDSGNLLRIIQIREIQPPFRFIQIPDLHSTIIPPPPPPPSIVATRIYQNKALQDRIDKYKCHSFVDLQKYNLRDEDMEIVVEGAIINKQCRQLRLQQQKMTSDGASIIAKALHNNTTLEVLDLSYNRVCDMGVHSLLN
ncbi:unnamed protein product [Didymodactylos carnosus]|uniref:NAD(P)(+)--arginine ADP-ribosyltransferase n=1 Tax=Didymodactylos carnosus TaxID=1234261 RepID=A0A815B3N1_9BILA|nr:unnamed protein product [Didymodactylos carnosus]CAF1268305.1 unnamed protein product [Didymodactylos carnosus]CAF4005768.1 unnamed protein product [Didymodactylos carnosus]CAF4053744.1 unnamed protein product [Didymodactylos carnosus]